MGSKGLGGHARIGGGLDGGGGRGGRGSGPHRKITRYMSRSISKLLPPLTKFPGFAQGGGGGGNLFHWNALEQIA